MKIPNLKKKAFQIDLGIYPFTVFVCFKDLKCLKATLEEYRFKIDADSIENILQDVERYAKTSTAIALQLNNGNIVLYFKMDCLYAGNYLINTITHEVFHATQMILERIGLKLHKKNDEAFCYLNGYINEKIFDQI